MYLYIYIFICTYICIYVYSHVYIYVCMQGKTGSNVKDQTFKEFEYGGGQVNAMQDLRLFERKFEIDSLVSVLKLASSLYSGVLSCMKSFRKRANFYSGRGKYCHFPLPPVPPTHTPPRRPSVLATPYWHSPPPTGGISFSIRGGDTGLNNRAGPGERTSQHRGNVVLNAGRGLRVATIGRARDGGVESDVFRK